GRPPDRIYDRKLPIVSDFTYDAWNVMGFDDGSCRVDVRKRSCATDPDSAWCVRGSCHTTMRQRDSVKHWASEGAKADKIGTNDCDRARPCLVCGNQQSKFGACEVRSADLVCAHGHINQYCAIGSHMFGGHDEPVIAYCNNFVEAPRRIIHLIPESVVTRYGSAAYKLCGGYTAKLECVVRAADQHATCTKGDRDTIDRCAPLKLAVCVHED